MGSISVRTEWRPVEGEYEVSSLGLVRNRRTGLVLRLSEDRGGYLLVSLTINGKLQRRRVHRLVMAAFSGEVCGGRDVNHKDGDKRNNCFDNLEYMSRSDNLRHAFALGLKTHRGENHPKSKYTQQQVDEVRSYLWQGCKHRDVSAVMRVPMHFVADVSAQRNWV